MYQALYRKYRPKTFSEVVGQSHITDTLQRQVAESRVRHAYLFTGTRGTGKTTCARILAKAVNCEHPVDGAPCCQCDSCRGIDAGTLLDVTELDAASNGRVNAARRQQEHHERTPCGGPHHRRAVGGHRGGRAGLDGRLRRPRLRRGRRQGRWCPPRAGDLVAGG